VIADFVLLNIILAIFVLLLILTVIYIVVMIYCWSKDVLNHSILFQSRVNLVCLDFLAIPEDKELR